MRKTTKREPRQTYKRGIQHVQVWGGDVNNPSPMLPLRAPISGTIVEKNATGGTGVRSLDNQPNLVTIADLSTVWVIRDAYQDLLPRVHVGDVAEVYLSNYPNQKYLGTLIDISEVLDLATRAAKIHIELPNSNRVFRAGMFVTTTFDLRKPVDQLVIPASAEVPLLNEDWVVVPADVESSSAAWRCSLV